MSTVDAQFGPEVERLLAVGRAPEALQAADRWTAAAAGSIGAWLARASANMHLGRIDAADRDLETAAKLAPGDERVRFLHGLVDQQLGRTDACLERLRGLAQPGGVHALEAWVAAGEMLWIASRLDELRAWVERPGQWTGDPRHAMLAARVRAAADPEGAAAALEAIAGSGAPPVVRRVAGFDAVRLLDRAGRYREAFALAGRVHAATGRPFNIDAFLAPVRAQQALLARGRWFTPQADPVDGLAMFVALPRSGTTLLEQMLDAHPEISGIGEYDGMRFLGEDLSAMGRTGPALAQLTRPDAGRLQRTFLDDAQRRRRPGARWMLDKNLRAWRMLPALAAVLPGTRCLHMVRDPRDMAISIHLSYFTPDREGWTSSLETVRRVVEAQESILPGALAALGLPHETIVYEDLVADPAGHAGRCLRLLGLGPSERVLRPEANARTTLTLSHAQVRAPINASSIGRWRHYDWAFGPAWDALAARHDARRQAR